MTMMSDAQQLLNRLEGLSYEGAARVEALIQKPAAGVHVLVDNAVVEAGKGFLGDHEKKDWWKGRRIEEREVTAISLEVLNALGASADTPGDNIITRGIDLRRLAPGQVIRIGDVRLRRAMKNHRPCHLFARRISEAGKQAVSELDLRGALFAVLEGGRISTGDAIVVENGDPAP